MPLSSHDIVKRLLEDYTQYELKYFSLVQYEGRKYYLCISKHSIFLVSPGTDEESKLADKEQIYLAWVKEVVVDTDDPMVFKLVLEERAPRHLESPIRQEILNKIKIYWKTDYMMRRQEVAEFPLSHDVVNFPEKAHHKGGEFTQAPNGSQKISHQGYFFWVKDQWEKQKPSEETLAWESELTLTFVRKDNDAVLKCTVNDPIKVANVARRERMGLRLFAERLACEQVPAGDEYVLISSDDHRKKMNLTGDPATWKCFAVHMRTITRDIGVIVVRRKYIPPFADDAQDLHFVLLGASGIYDTTNFMDTLERIVDCVSAENQNYFFDSLLIRAKLDGLMCDEESFAWYQAHLNMYPQLLPAIQAFIVSVATMLEDNGADIIARELEPEAIHYHNPFEIVSDINKLGPDIDENSEPEAIEAWQRKVARYLAFCVDGGLHSELRLTLFVKLRQTPNLELKVADLIDKLLEYFLYIRSKRDRYEEGDLREKLLNDQLMEAFTVNERVLCRLLELEYIQDILDPREGDVAEEDYVGYNTVDFLLLLLERDQNTAELQSAALAQIALLCQKDDKTKEVLVEKGIVNVMLDLLEKTEDDLMLLSVGKALVNVSANNIDAKEQIIKGGVAKLVLPMLTFEKEELAFTLASLLKNCMDTEAHREILGRAGAVNALLSLLREITIPSGRSSDHVFAVAASALWNLAANPSNVSRIQKAGGVEKIVAILKRTKNDTVLQKVCGCIMVIATYSDEIKQEIHDADAVPTLCHLLSASRNVVLLRNVCGALAFLSSNSDVMPTLTPIQFTMKQERVEEGLDIAVKSREKHIRKFATQILSLLAPDS